MFTYPGAPASNEGSADIGPPPYYHRSDHNICRQQDGLKTGSELLDAARPPWTTGRDDPSGDDTADGCGPQVDEDPERHDPASERTRAVQLERGRAQSDNTFLA